jgi:diguanylate cyclase (GGDEF)-like protein
LHYSVALFDLDDFQRYNEEHGRASGDRALKRITAYVRSMVRKSDRLYRFGGDEIVVLLPETTLEGASILGRRIVDGAGQLGLSTRLDRLDLMTISCGVTSVDAEIAPTVRWRGVLDRALYQAKRQGKTRLAA